jgi:hypothetical protein
MIKYKFIFRQLMIQLPVWLILLVLSSLILSGCNGKETTSTTSAVDSSNPADPENKNNSTDAAPIPKAVAPQPASIPKGVTLAVRLLETIDSETARAGQDFEAELAASLSVNGKVVLPTHTPIKGRVVAARASGRLHNPGYLRLTLASIKTKDDKWVDIETTSISAEGKSHKKRNLALVGGGSALGAVIGAVAGGGKGAAIGAASGAGAGTAGAYATGKKDVSFEAEQKLSFATVNDTLLE